jgi:tetratricopeptide (TPR) repeat protein
MYAMLMGVTVLALAGPAPQDSVPLYDNLGGHHYQVTTSDAVAQRYFDQGLRLYYAFNHAEAVRSFEEGARRDPSCVMCLWGVAVALGPNINMPMDPEVESIALEAIRAAQARADLVSPVERAVIEATARRYGAESGPDRTALDSAYTDALRRVVQDHPEDLEAATLFAESLMTLRPWAYWTRDGAPEPGTLELLEHLERVLAANPNHPGACHFFIHAVEAVDPERAVPCAERLAGLMPGAGHLVHMPGHIYIRVGRYMDAIRANEHAVHADESYIQDQRPGMGIYTVGYYPHNYDFMAFAAAMAGRRTMAIDAAEKVTELIPEEILGMPGFTMLQNYVTRSLQMRVRFGDWDGILAYSEPAADLHFARAIRHYARGRAFLGKDEPEAARAELDLLRAVAADPSLEGVTLDFNDAKTVLEIAERVLAGTLASALGRHDEAIDHLRRAAELEDHLIYGEPPEWSIPVRHDMGDVLLAAGRWTEAEAAFNEDLDRFPENGWALSGLARALRGQGRVADAHEVEAQFEVAWREADAGAPSHPH